MLTLGIGGVDILLLGHPCPGQDSSLRAARKRAEHGVITGLWTAARKVAIDSAVRTRAFPSMSNPRALILVP